MAYEDQRKTGERRTLDILFFFINFYFNQTHFQNFDFADGSVDVINTPIFSILRLELKIVSNVMPAYFTFYRGIHDCLRFLFWKKVFKNSVKIIKFLFDINDI